MPTPSLFPGAATHFSRRNFLKTSSLAAGAAALAGPSILRGQGLNNKINVAVIGAGGKGASDTDEVARLGENIVALCDVDLNTLDARTSRNPRSNQRSYPQAARFQDYRKMLEVLGKSIDAVIVATPDHHHAPAAALAMNLGKHAYVQKPLTHSVYEARTLRRLAKEKKVATQMGNQGSAGSGLRRAVEVIHAGVVGKPLELHVWSNRPIWPQGLDRPPGEDPVPEHLNWDLWIGPAQMRPYKENPAPPADKEGRPRRGSGVYHPFAWRGWRDFGTGALGDMACHTVNMAFRALKLGYPNVVECEEVSDRHAETYPKTSRLRFEFPAREGFPPLKFWWYDGNPQDKSVRLLRPPEDLTKEILPTTRNNTLPPSGCLIIGDKGKIFSPDDYGSQFYLLFDDTGYKPASSRTEGQTVEHEAIRHISQTIPRSPGHYKEWVDAIRGGPPAYSNFDIAAYLTEIILLGCVAMRVGVGKKLDWDGPNMRAKNAPEADQYVKREYRQGWTV